MIKPGGEWKRFENNLERLLFFRRCGLHLSLAVNAQPTLYGFLTEHQLPKPCEVVGYQCKKWAIIQIGEELGCIHGEYLADMQIIQGKIPEKFNLRLPTEYIVIDTETTALSPKFGEMIEIAAIKYCDGVAVDEFVTLLDPKTRIPRKVSLLTGIKQSDVEGQPSWEDVQDQFFGFIEGYPLIGHNIRFDIGFIEAQSKRTLRNRTHDTLDISRKIFPGLPCHKLEYLKDLLDLPVSGSHRAKADVETTNALLLLLDAVSKE